jgi:hypothetical protein
VTAKIVLISEGDRTTSKGARTATDFVMTGNPVTVNADIGPGKNSGFWGPVYLSIRKTTVNQDRCANATVHLRYTSN